MFVLKCVILASCLAALHAQNFNGPAPATTPVPILKQINKQNDDGSYSYGYEAADGSFKIETKYPNGDVAGKYGYVDENGKTREISYGASSKRGFEPQGTGIMVPPPTLSEGNSNALTDGQEDDGQYREDPKIYEDPKYNKASTTTFRQFHRPAQPEPQQLQSFQQLQARPQVQQYQSQPQYQEQPQTSQFRSSPLYSQQTSLFPQQTYQQQTFPQHTSPQQTYPQQAFPQQTVPQQGFFSQQPQQFQNYRPQSQIYHQQPQFSYQAYTPQYNDQYQNYQNYNPFSGHPAQNFDPNTGSYTINFTG